MKTAVICNMMHKKQGITGHHDQSVACKFQKLKTKQTVQGRNKLLITSMLLHAQHYWLWPPHHHPRVEPRVGGGFNPSTHYTQIKPLLTPTLLD